MEVTDELKDYLYRKMIVMIASKKKTLLQNLYIYHSSFIAQFVKCYILISYF